jgi:class 3 adenylate cyclase
VGARVGALASPGEVLTSRTVRDLSAGSGLAFESLGPQHLKAVPENIEVFASGLTDREATVSHEQPQYGD